MDHFFTEDAPWNPHYKIEPEVVIEVASFSLLKTIDRLVRLHLVLVFNNKEFDKYIQKQN